MSDAKTAPIFIPAARPKKKDLKINKLIPPAPVQHRIIRHERNRLHQNWVIRGLQKFFLKDGF